MTDPVNEVGASAIGSVPLLKTSNLEAFKCGSDQIAVAQIRFRYWY